MATETVDPRRVRGHVRMPSGEPLTTPATVRVFLTDTETSDVISERFVERVTDDDGMFDIELELGEFPQIWTNQGRARMILQAFADPDMVAETYQWITRNQQEVEVTNLVFLDRSTTQVQPETVTEWALKEAPSEDTDPGEPDPLEDLYEPDGPGDGPGNDGDGRNDVEIIDVDLEEEVEHQLTGNVIVMRTDQAGNPVCGACFELLDRQGNPVTDRLCSDDDAYDCRIVFTEVPEGRYTLRETHTPRGFQIARDMQIDVSADLSFEAYVQSVAYVRGWPTYTAHEFVSEEVERVLQKFFAQVPQGAAPVGGTPGTGGGTPGGSVPDYTPLLNEAIDVITGLGGRAFGASSPRPAGSGMDLDRFFDDAALKVLGTKVRADQPDELFSAFDRVFVEKEIDGQRIVEYRGTSGAATLSTEPSQVTSGPQAVLYQKARADLGPIRQALMELRADDDDRQDEFEAVRDVIDHELTELVDILGQDVRLPVSRVEAVFSRLLGPLHDVDPQISHLGQLRTLVGFAGPGLTDPNDMTREEDRTSTRYIEIQFYVESLYANWIRVKSDRIVNNPKGPLGNRLQLLGLQLDRVAELADDLDIALTADSIDAAEREFLIIQNVPETSMSELMEWLWSFARTSKSYTSVKGIQAVQQTAADIDVLVTSAIRKFWQQNPGPGFRSRQVRRALEDIQKVLVDIRRL